MTEPTSYETKQVNMGYRDAMRKFDGDAKRAAEAYGDDVIKMLNRPARGYWISLGLIRLYTRIAVRLAADFASL